MTAAHDSTDYSELLRLFAAAHALAEPAEAHGTLAGALCAASGYTLEDWVSEVLPEGEVDPAADLALRGLYEQTRNALLGHEMQFELVIPQDEESLERRAAALGQWCNGFLYGLAGHGSVEPEELPGDAGEVVRDIGEITRAGVDASESEESNEAAYVELVEFVRVGVQLVFEEMAARRQPPARAASRSVH